MKFSMLLFCVPTIAFAQTAIESSHIYEMIPKEQTVLSDVNTLYLNIETENKIVLKKEVDVSSKETILRASFKEFVNQINQDDKKEKNIPFSQQETLNAFNKSLNQPLTVEQIIKNITTDLNLPAENEDELITYLKNNLVVNLVYNKVDYGNINIKYKDISPQKYSILLNYSSEEIYKAKSSHYKYVPNIVNIQYPFEFIVSEKTNGKCYKTILNKISINHHTFDVTGILCNKAKLK